MKRQVTVVALLVSSVTLSGCAAEIGSRSASEDTAMTAGTDGTSSADGVPNANGNQGDGVEDNSGDSGHSQDEYAKTGAGLRGETGARGDEDFGVLPPPGEFDPADPDFKLFDPCTEIPPGKLELKGFRRLEDSSGNTSGTKSCSFQRFDDGVEFSISALNVPMTAKDLDEDYIVKYERGGRSENIVYRGELFTRSSCMSSTNTPRGQVTITFVDLSGEPEQICKQVNEIYQVLKWGE
ncbi:hypothetical protein GWO63_011655 [Corynebacterium macginleyi]|uniref:DUF3558 domain-containing protein n=1 Tax=Corynebacterium macginleyi TaxID=38290 RepID=A0ABS1Y8Y6_9CORY|nr:hypothetical protein [Corynebacterium macginleyi]MBK4144762.1 hypothetical protein [Corynebacterium macginleyi]MBK4164605.1 hypothetical protein [Corynebacterium macginleyi]MBM0244866.1 hypothetical protein [Corynebacterium macginleyi]